MISFSRQTDVAFSNTATQPLFTPYSAHRDYELLDAGNSEKPSSRAFHITANNEVTVYGSVKRQNKRCISRAAD